MSALTFVNRIARLSPIVITTRKRQRDKAEELVAAVRFCLTRGGADPAPPPRPQLHLV